LRPFSENGSFRLAVAVSGLRRSAIAGVGVTVLAQGVSFAIQMIATLVLARLLMPADFGLVTMVTTVSVLIVSCGQIGFPEAVIQRETLNHRLASNLFWVNLAVGVVLTIALAFAGGALAWFYGDSRLTYVTAGASLSVVCTSLGILHLALLKRAMCFSVVAANDIVSKVVSVGVSILLGLAGWQYWALIVGLVIQPLANSTGAWILCQWVPTLPRRQSGTRSAMRFAFSVYGRWGIGYLAQNLDNILVGWRFGPMQLGFYKKAYDLFSLPFNLLSVYPVAVSTLSRLNQSPDEYRRYLMAGLSMMALVGMGIGANLTLIAPDVVRLLLGPNWVATGRIFSFFGPGIGMMLIYTTHGMIHLSLGTTRRYVRWGVVEFTVTTLLFLAGLSWGPIGMAVAWTASYWILTIPGFWYAGKPIHFSIRSLVATIWRYIAASFLSAFTVALLLRLVPSFQATATPIAAFIRIMVTSLLFSVIYTSSVVALHGSFGPIVRLLDLVREMMPTPRSLDASLIPSRSTAYIENTVPSRRSD